MSTTEERAGRDEPMDLGGADFAELADDELGLSEEEFELDGSLDEEAFFLGDEDDDSD